MEKMEQFKKIVYVAYVFILSIYIVISLLTGNTTLLIDAAIGIIVIGIFYLIERKHKIPLIAVAIGLLPVILHNTGALGLYAHFYFGLGYDKYLHLISGFCITFLVFNFLIINNESRKYWKLAAAIMIMLGLGTIIEVNEFVGEKYFGVEGAGLFTQGDDLPEVRSDLQRYDTYYDHIFNLLGSILSVPFIMLLFQIKKRNLTFY